ncbi:MAG: RNA-splicing ligase RtcB [Candidatus Aenigmatarchaeota archaeon]|nr:MAG: RNA-splicing ligase RtcB [Candidatus Aenigmarchaeota archaeon]
MKDKLQKISDYEWLLPKGVRDRMKVDAKIFANQKIIDAAEDAAVQQLTNVACLPGVLEPVIGLPDMHWGYGLPMGAVGAFDAEEGIISSGLCGFDINCGINLIRTNLTVEEVKAKIKELIPTLFKNVPSGVGAKGPLKLTREELDRVLVEGIDWAIEKGYATKEDKEHTEEKGRMNDADPSKVSDLAKKRGIPQLGTLGAGNHFLEIQEISDIFDEETAKKWGLHGEGTVVIMLHSGSRGFGHQVASDYLKIQEKAVKKYNIWLPDKQLACAPVNSEEGRDYFSAMKCAVNYAFVNRAVMTKWIRDSFEQVFKKDWKSMDMKTVYGIAHNIVKLEEHKIGGKGRKVYVHRKGATRSFPETPVLIAGSMGTASYLLKGTETAMEKTFGSSAHGAGRVMSRATAIKKFWGETVREDLEKQGIIAKSTHPKVLSEEAPQAYKDVEAVVETVHQTGISLKVARMKPMGVVKG